VFISLWAFKNYIFQFLVEITGFLLQNRVLMPAETAQNGSQWPLGIYGHAEPGFFATFLCTPLEQNKKIGIPF